MVTPATSEPTRRALPRLVDQVRALLWLQFYATMAGLLGVLLVGGLAASAGLGRAVERKFENWSITAMFVLVALAVPLWLGSRLWSRGWAWVYVLVAVTELGAVAATVFFFRSGIAFGVGAVIFVGLTGWVLVDLGRGEVRRFFF